MPNPAVFSLQQVQVFEIFDSFGIDFCLEVDKCHLFFLSTSGYLVSLAAFTKDAVLSLMYIFGTLVKN